MGRAENIAIFEDTQELYQAVPKTPAFRHWNIRHLRVLKENQKSHSYIFCRCSVYIPQMVNGGCSCGKVKTHSQSI